MITYQHESFESSNLLRWGTVIQYIISCLRHLASCLRVTCQRKARHRGLARFVFSHALVDGRILIATNVVGYGNAKNLFFVSLRLHPYKKEDDTGTNQLIT